MLPLDSPRWAELTHAYGTADNIPPLLRKLGGPSAQRRSGDAWPELWSALAHQGDVYPASFAAVPHVVRILSTEGAGGDTSFFHFPACVEIGRCRGGMSVPDDLRVGYEAALEQVPALVAAVPRSDWTTDLTRCALSALAAARGQIDLAEILLELDSDTLADTSRWLDAR